MNIIFTIRYFHPFIGGTEKQALALAASLVKRGISVKIITSRFEKKWPRREVIDDVEIIRLFSPKIKILGAVIFLFYLTVYFIKNRRDFSIIHTFQIGYTSSVSILLGILLKKPSMLKLASSGWGGDVQRAQKTFLGKIFLYMCKRANRMIILSKTMEDELLKEGINSFQITLIYNGVDLTRFKEMKEKIKFRGNLNIEDKKTIIYTGRLSHEKGVDFLIHSFSKLDIRAGCQLLIVADGPEREDIIRIIDHYRLSKSVVMINEVDDIAIYLNAADLFVLPSRFEGLSNSLLEAMACGLPVISTRVGGSVDIIKDGINGLLVDVDDEQQLNHAMSRILKDSLLTYEMGRNARKTVEQNHDLKKIADKYLEQYKSLQ